MFQKNSGSEKAYGKKGGVSRVPVEKFLSHRAEKFLGEPFCAVFQKTYCSGNVYGQEGGVPGHSLAFFRVSQCRKNS